MESVSPASGTDAPSRPRRPALCFVLAVALAVAAACEAGPTPQSATVARPEDTAGPWAAFWQVVQRFIPESTAFQAYMPRITDPERPDVDLTIFPAFAGGKLRVIPFSGRGETFLATYNTYDVYKLGETLWAKLADGQPSLWAGSPSDEALHRYLDFFDSRQPALTNERFWNAFAYAEACVRASLGADVALLQFDFDDAWQAGGL